MANIIRPNSVRPKPLSNAISQPRDADKPLLFHDNPRSIMTSAGPSCLSIFSKSIQRAAGIQTTSICRRCLHKTRPSPATPLPITAHGPPPKAPLPAASQYEDRVARRKAQSEMIRRGQALRAAQKPGGGALKKRFWKHVSVQEKPEGLQVFLDSRPVRTPSKATLNLPHSKRQLALAIALEWDLLVSAQQALKQHLIPLTSLVSRAEDIKAQDQRGESKDRDEIVDMVMRYLDTDTLLCWAPEASAFEGPDANIPGGADRPDEQGRSLRDLQHDTAQPTLSFLTTNLWPGTEIHPVADSNSILPSAQPQMTKDIIRGWITGLPAYELAGMERAVLATKSLLVAARFVAEWSNELDPPQQRQEADVVPSFGIDEAAEAATLEVTWQTRMWGEVEDSHDVDKEDLRRQLGSVVLLVSNDQA